MKGITKAARKANARSFRCNTCPYDYHRCTPEIGRVCTDSFLEGFKKGTAWARKQLESEANGNNH